MKSPRDQEIVSWWGWGQGNLFHHEIISWLGWGEFVDSKTFSPRDQEIVSWWGWGETIFSSFQIIVNYYFRGFFEFGFMFRGFFKL